MNNLTRLGIGLGILAAGTGSLLGLRAPLAELSAAQATLVLTAHQETTLQLGLDAVSDRHAARARILDELGDSRITLLEAAARFRAINAGMPASVQEVVARNYQGIPEPERDCRVVIEYLRNYFRESAAHQAVVGRLENDLCDLLHSTAPSAEPEWSVDVR